MKILTQTHYPDNGGDMPDFCLINLTPKLIEEIGRHARLIQRSQSTTEAIESLNIYYHDAAFYDYGQIGLNIAHRIVNPDVTDLGEQDILAIEVELDVEDMDEESTPTNTSIRGYELVIRADGFYLSCYEKYSDGSIETPYIDFKAIPSLRHLAPVPGPFSIHPVKPEHAVEWVKARDYLDALRAILALEGAGPWREIAEQALGDTGA